MSDENLVRQADLTLAADAPVQQVRGEVMSNNTGEEMLRYLQYGFASAPAAGQGLILEAGGLAVVLAFDQLADRPGLALNEVMIWHKDGHFIKLNNQGEAEIKALKLKVDAPETEYSGNVLIKGGLGVEKTAHCAGAISSDADVTAGSVSLQDHSHTLVQPGPGNSGPPKK